MIIESIGKAAELIAKGYVVAFPTETVYGLGADATNYQACERVYHIKQRPNINPLIVHVDSLEQARTIGEFSDTALKLARLWPGPLTLVVPLKKNSQIASNVTAGLNTVAIRWSSHKVAQSLISLAGVPIAAPSANFSGYISPTNAVHIFDDFTEDIPIIVGEVNFGIESTIIDTTRSDLTILRYGFITPEDIKQLTGYSCLFNNLPDRINSPGLLSKHYAPKTPLRLNATYLLKQEIGLGLGTIEFCDSYCLNLSIKADLMEAAFNLYSMLRKLDYYAQKYGYYKAIAVAPIPQEGIGLAINDRIRRASNII